MIIVVTTIMIILHL
jgi:hypothetical protein